MTENTFLLHLTETLCVKDDKQKEEGYGIVHELVI